MGTRANSGPASMPYSRRYSGTYGARRIRSACGHRGGAGPVPAAEATASAMSGRGSGSQALRPSRICFRPQPRRPAAGRRTHHSPARPHLLPAPIRSAAERSHGQELESHREASARIAGRALGRGLDTRSHIVRWPGPWPWPEQGRRASTCA